MAKIITKTKADFSGIFIKDVPVTKKAESLVDILDNYIYDVYNNDKSAQEASYGGALTNSFHPSRLAKATCIRKMVYEYLNAPYIAERKDFSAQSHRIFHNGHAVHERLQNYIADLNVYTEGKCSLIGRWMCKDCKKRYGYSEGNKKEADCWVSRPEKCECGANRFRFKYMEVGIEIPEFRVKGKADGVLEWKVDRILIEIKSMNPFQYMKLTSPPGYYLPQAMIYLKGTGLKNMLWLFEDKATQDLKEYITQYDEKIIVPIFDKLVIANSAITAEVFPDKPKTKVGCRACEYRLECESGKDYKEYLIEVPNEV